QPILLGMGRSCVSTGEGVWLPSLRKGVDEWESMLCSVGKLYVEGAEVDWSGMERDGKRQKVVLPTYPFQRQRYWIDSYQNEDEKMLSESLLSPIFNLINQGNTEALTKELSLAETLTEDEQKLLPKVLGFLVDRHQNYLHFKGNIVHDYYNAVTSITEKLVSNENKKISPLNFLKFGIFPETIPGFSWLKLVTETDQEKFNLVCQQAQRELRKLCFSQVDFSSCEKVLDFGCGYGSDLIELAQNNQNLQLTGYTISAEKAKFATNKVNGYQLHDRVKIFNRDSSKDEFPDNYNLVFGFEVAHHIKNKDDLFSNISRHLEEEGLLVLADFIANDDISIDHEETSSYFITKQLWAEKLSQNNLKLISFVDVSQEIANFLYDPDFEETLSDLSQKNIDPNIKAAFQSYNQLGKLLQKGLASYVLLTARKQESLLKEDVYQSNQEILDRPFCYSEVAIKQWVYELEWKHSENSNKESISASDCAEPGTWLLFVTANLATQELAKVLEEHSKNCVLVFPGSNYKQLDKQHYQINPINPQDFKQLIQELLTAQPTLEGVVHLWSLDTSVESLTTAQKIGCGSVLHLVQTLVSDLEYPVSLSLVTQGSQAVEENPQILQVQQGPVWGLGRVIAQEHPDLQCRLVDLDPTSDTSEALQALAKELLHPDDEPQMAIRQGTRYVARLARQREKSGLEQPQQVTLQAESSYLITGGLGALGLEVAQWMAKNGVTHLVLTGRRSPSEKAMEIIKELKQAGTKISILLGDISQEQDVAEIFKQIQASLPPLKGIIHAAGVIEDGVLQQMTWEQFTRVIAPKVEGSWHLHQLSKDIPLDFFVCFSSIASLFGSPGQGNYAAGNAFMDSLAHYRRYMGLPGLSINWGAWEQEGMVARLETQHQTRLKKTGIGYIAPNQGLQVLEELLSQSITQVGVSPINWSQLIEQLSAGIKPPFLEAFTSTKLAKEESSNDFLAQLTEATESERNQLLINYLQATIGKLLGFSKSLFPEPQLGFFDMGIDSLMAVELRNMLSATLGYSISAATLFKYSNIQDLTEYLIEEIFERENNDKFDLENSKSKNNIDMSDLDASEPEPEFQGEIEDTIAEKFKKIQNLLNENN
ncbi:SDR family NAD(P)-dependent oxidoreductase, partial [Moorena sp. SIO3H5]|uniref:SDR family NAD(P)-dependent oxidoreductase n=1 Tax=Moorena sp. SIO3H5 TaxID=2607834 RepID=UPI0013BDDB20